MTPRRGGTLLELVVGLPLLALAAALAVQLFVSHLRVVDGQAGRIEARRALAHASAALAADLRPLAARDLVAWTDTSVVAWVPVLTAVVCGVPAPGVIDLVSGDAAWPLRAVGSAEPRAGDRAAWSAPDTALVGAPAAALDSVAVSAAVLGSTRASRACEDSPLRGGTTPRRLELAAGGEPPPEPGTQLVVQRRVEWRLYRASDGVSWLGRRDWNGSAWSTVQPVAGPLHHRVGRGVLLEVLRADGGPSAPGEGDAVLVRIALRAPRGGVRGGGGTDSLTLQVGLRGGR